MSSWVSPSPVTAAMLNPALLAAVTAAASEEYARSSGVAMPWPYAFLIAPLVLHRDTREALPRDTRTYIATWITQNPVLRAGFPERARSLVDPVRAGLRFGLTYGVLAVTAEGGLRGALADAARPAKVGDIEVIVRRAGFAGRWLSKLDQSATAFALFGVTP